MRKIISIINFFSTYNRKRLLENFIFLSLLQMVYYIIPLITFPYLIKVLGTEKFGLISFSQAFIYYFVILTDYGFNLSATRSISVNRNNQQKISEIFNGVMFLKLIFLIITFILMTIIVFSFKKFYENWLLYLLTYGLVIGQSLFPIWLFQGMEKMKYITLINVLAKVIFTIAIFIFVKNSADYILVPFFNSLGFILAGIISLIIAIKNFHIKFYLPNYSTLKYYFKDGWIFFKTTVFLSAYRESNIFILGLITNNTITSYYAIAEKTIKIIQSIQTPLGQALYPHVCNKYASDSNNFTQYHFKYQKIIYLFYLVIAIVTFLFSNYIIKIITGLTINEAIINLKILSFVLIIGGLNYYHGILGLIPLKLENLFSTFVTITGLINIILCIILSYIYKDIGASLSLLISETLLLFLILNKLYNLSKK
ncbi:MAG TPA: oligosaccharide flippase family protein [Ignavibacteriales bacterium]|nr:oligosaccharide flippase family protein [Ignavibacteriales bacterium]